MNTFALILFAYPLYLAINGKLMDYANLAAQSSSSAPAAGQSSSTNPAP